MTEKTDYLNKLKAQRAKLEARIQAAESRTKVAERKKDLRRKILVGSYYLKQAAQNNQMDTLRKHMEEFLTRSSDRALFDLDTLGDVYLFAYISIYISLD